jgi:hypothetical protein
VDKVQRKKITSVKVFFFGAKMKQTILKQTCISGIKKFTHTYEKKILLEMAPKII